MNGYGNDRDRCSGRRTTEVLTISGNSPTQAMPKAISVDDSSIDYLEQPRLVEVRPQLNKISPPGPECLPPEEGQLLPPDISNVHPGEEQSLPSKDTRRYPQQGKRVPAAIEESPVSPKIALPKPVSTTSSLDRRVSLLRIVDHCRYICLGKCILKQGSFGYDLSPRVWKLLRRGQERPLLIRVSPGTEAFVTSGRAATPEPGLGN